MNCSYKILEIMSSESDSDDVDNNDEILESNKVGLTYFVLNRSYKFDKIQLV